MEQAIQALTGKRETQMPSGGVRAVQERVRTGMGSIAGAGSGEFHTYRKQKRHEEERLARMERNAQAIAEREEFEERKRMREEKDEERTAKKREKRLKKKKARKHGQQQEAMRRKALEILSKEQETKEPVNTLEPSKPQEPPTEQRNE